MPLNDADWQVLVGRINAGACTPFIGAGACAGVLPLGGALAEQLLNAELAAAGPAGGAVPLPNPRDLAQVTEYIAVTHEDNPWPKLQIANLWRQVPPPDFTRQDEPHGLLADLPLPVYLTTNYDNFMFAALKSRHKDPRREICRWNDVGRDTHSAFDDGYEPSVANPVVFHLHGHADAHESMVVTEDDYLDFLVSISKDLATAPTGAGQWTILPLPIRNAITGPTLMFIGYGLADINFRVILRGMVGSLTPSRRKLSIAVQLHPGNRQDPERLEAYLEHYFRWMLNVRIYWGTAQEFAGELRARR